MLWASASNYSFNMVYFCYFMMLTAIFFAQETKTSDLSLYKMFVNNEQVGFNSVLWVNRSLPVLIACRMTIANNNLVMRKIIGLRKYTLASAVTVNQTPYTFLNYTLTEHDKWSLVTTYRCVDKRKQYAPNYFQVTITFTHDLPNTPADTLPPHVIVNTHPPTSWTLQQRATVPTFALHTTEETHTVSPRIRGLNPLIYVVAVLILLGSLALVSLITCWIRVRRSYNRRHYRLTNNPQDYLDYISDNDLTPLGSSELAASFEERPPSYSESEEMSESEAASSRKRQNGGRIIESVLRRSRILSSSRLRPSSSGRDIDGDSSEGDNAPPTVRIFLPRPTLTVPHTVAAAVRPSVSSTQFTSRSTSHNIPSQQNTEPTVNESGINNQNRGVPQILSLPQSTTTSTEESSGALRNCNAHMSSGVDDLMSMNLNTRNGNGTQPSSLEPIPQSESCNETPVGMLIDLT